MTKYKENGIKQKGDNLEEEEEEEEEEKEEVESFEP